MNKTLKRIVGAATAASLITGSAMALAGEKVLDTVTVNKTNSFAYGSVGDARASADQSQYIGCVSFGDNYGSSTPSGYCYAQDASGSGSYVYCWWSGVAQGQSVSSISNISLIEFSWTSGFYPECGYVRVDNSSYYTPSVP
jgi:hypothetical protein